MMKTLVAALLLFFPLIPRGSFAQHLEPGRLTCEYQVNPLGLDTRAPRFGWTMKSEKGEQVQTAYELIVSDDASAAQKHIGNVWSPGKVESSQQNQLEYGGAPLKARTRYYWRLRVYDGEDRASDWSAINFFETAMLDQEDWQAQWIGDGLPQPTRDEDYYGDDPMPLLRRQFPVSKPVSSARLYISGVGYYEASLNGEKIADLVLDPGWTTYRKQVLYSVYDVTALLHRGENVVGVMLGNGWWNPLPLKLFGRWDLRDYQQTGRPCVKAELHIQYDDSTREIIATDESWMTTPGPMLRNNVYLGEHYDARREISGWNTARADTKTWNRARIVGGPSGMLTAQVQPGIKVTRVVKPVKISEWKPGIQIVDMGQNFAGGVQLTVNGKAGTRITLRYGEGLFEDGSLNVMTTVATQIKKGGIKGGPGAPETAWQEDSYTLRGKGEETWAPRFTFHGFRYVEVTGWPGKLTPENISGLRMNAELTPNGTFSCSNEDFNRIHDVVQWTFLSNVFSVQSDCPGREKMGYGADIVVTANAFMYNYDMAHFYAKTVRDFANEQRPLGGITEIAPFTGIADRGYGDLSGPLGWQLVFPYLQKQLYDFYGDKRILAENYAALKKQIDFLKSQAQGNLFFRDISDHEAIDPKPESLSASAFYYHHVLLAAEVAGILGHSDDSVAYSKLHQQIRGSIVNQFYIPATGRFDNATQSAQLFALWYDLSPDTNASFEVLMKEIERHKGHLSTGIFSTQMFFDVMRRRDRNDVAVRVVNAGGYPGWRHMLASGATTLWESWDFPETVPSRNHPMFGSVDEWFYRSLLGINSGSPGFERVTIKPQPAGLAWAKGSYRSIRGLITSDWKVEGKRFILRTGIPPNTRAEIWIPAAADTPVELNGKAIQPAKRLNGYAVIETGSGEFVVTAQQQ